MRFLTRQTKEFYLRDLEKLYKTATPEKSTGGGIATLDSPLVPYLKRLNKVFGLVTIYSCSGHEEGGSLGIIEMRLTKRNTKLFDSHITELLRDPVIVEAAKVYGLSGDPRQSTEVAEWVRIRFLGEDNDVPLDRSMSHIIKFFEKICVPSMADD